MLLLFCSLLLIVCQSNLLIKLAAIAPSILLIFLRTVRNRQPYTEENRSNNEKRHEVNLSSFSIMDKAVSQELYANIMGQNPSYLKLSIVLIAIKKLLCAVRRYGICPFPVETVTWLDARQLWTKS